MKLLVTLHPRPYVMRITLPATLADPRRGETFLISSTEAQALIDRCAVRRATRTHVVVEDGNGTLVTIRPATIGGGPAFTITRSAQL